MAETKLSDVTSAIQEFWSPLFMDELRQQNLLVNLVNRDYTGSLQQMGDTVRVNQINAPTGQRLTIDQAGAARTFTPEAVSLSSATIVANQRIVASYDFDDLVAIQSMIDPLGARATEVRSAMVHAASVQLNDYLYSLVASAAPITSVATLDAATVAQVREYAGKQKWEKSKGWYGLLSPEYYADLLQDTTFTNADFGAEDRPVIGGQFGINRYGFNLFEDNSIDADTFGTGKALFFHPDWLYMVMQYEPRFKVSDKHSNNEFAMVMSVDFVMGAVLGIDGATKHVEVRPGA